VANNTPSLSSYAFSEYGHDAKLYNGIAELEERIRTLEAEQNDKVRAFNLMLTSLNPMIRRLAERYLDGISNYDEFVKFLQSHPLEAIDAARKGATE